MTPRTEVADRVKNAIFGIDTAMSRVEVVRFRLPAGQTRAWRHMFDTASLAGNGRAVAGVAIMDIALDRAP